LGSPLFEVDPDIARAHTPPGRLYADPEVYALVRERVFARSWQLVADADAVRIPGAVHPVTLLDGCLDEPLLLTRDHADALHCLSNVCTHRGTLVAEHPGCERTLTCRYHGRRFALDGSFMSMPGFEGVAGFPGPQDSLPRVPFAVWRRFVFAALSPAVPFERVVADMDAMTRWMPVDGFRPDPSRQREYLVRANWALYVDNYLEGFHIPFVHASLARAIDVGSYRTDLFEWSVLQVGESRDGHDALEPPGGQRPAAWYWWLFPNLMFNFYPWGVSVNVVRPLGPDLTRVSFLAYVWREDRLGRGAGAEIDRVEREDEAVVEAVQRGLRSRLYERGRYSPRHEAGVHHFHRLLARALAEA
jgi:choline monooxygenase